MTRAQAIAAITSALTSFDDERVLAVAELVKTVADGDDLPRRLTDRELALIEQSREDFRDGRTYPPAEARIYIDDELARRRALRGQA